MTTASSHVYLVRLYFHRTMHVGANLLGIGKESSLPYVHSDTLYSALVNTWADSGGDLTAVVPPKQAAPNTWQPALRISSAFPFISLGTGGLQYYLPRPLLPPPNFAHPDRGEQEERRYSKEVKTLFFIPLEDFLKWIASDPMRPPDLSPTKGSQLLFRVQHARDRLTEATGIYLIGETAQSVGGGLYCLVRIEDPSRFSLDQLEQVFRELGRRGLGGRRSTGSGHYQYYEIEDLQQRPGEWAPLFSQNAGAQGYVLLSLYNDPHMRGEDCYAYRLVPRQGRMYSMQAFGQPIRKRVWMFAEGSVFRVLPKGRLVDVTPDDFTVHKVYRYGYAFPIAVLTPP